MVYPNQPHYTDFEVPILNRPIDDPGRTLRVVCVGGGIAGITTAIRFRQHLGNQITFQIYEKNDDVGGVWLENRYPGVACDVPAPCFAFLFEDNVDWTSYYAGGVEIYDYIKHVATKYQVQRDIKFGHVVQGAVWHEDEGRWHLTVLDKATGTKLDDTADILILGWGQLNHWAFPDVPGLHSFQGPYMHSAAYDATFDATDKTVALVGGGSTGVQILPQLQPVARKVQQYMRSQNWIAPVGFGSEELEKRGALAQGNFDYSDDEKKAWKDDPSSYHSYRRHVEERMMALMTEEGFKYGTPEQQAMETQFREHMKTALRTRPDILKTLLPDFPPGCRRLVPGPGYLDAVVKDNVEWIPQGIDRVVENGIVTTDGQLHQCDAIIWATGFITDFDSRFPMVGRDGITWNQVCRPEPEAYLGVLTDKMPNCFLYLGPNAAPGAGNAYLCVELECAYAIKCIRKMLLEKIKSMCVKTERVKQYTAHAASYNKATIFGQNCRCWFKPKKDGGRNIAYYPGNSLSQMIAMESPRWEDFDYTYCDELNGNPMGWLASGFTRADYDGSSRTTYLDPANIDYPPVPTVNGNREQENGTKCNASTMSGN
ncbi:hypothetical protein Sste5346_010421 [Sporothrix stenoceras]|uniref:Flavin-binding monooxygenase n=1 Tax=Sporothrix stenoceras TaxID=5173 RepID=A0ABR3YFW6_9PEZI